jgi:ABC-type uncharacterized transport system ATPase subunit
VIDTQSPSVPQQLDAIDIAVAFGGLKAIDSVSLTLKIGEVVGLIGPTGQRAYRFPTAEEGPR